MKGWKKITNELADLRYLNAPQSFQSHHVVVSFLLIGAHQPLGRYDLCTHLSLGEGSVRSLMKRLTKGGYIVAEGKQGQRLTAKGEELFDDITGDIPLGLFLELSELTLHEFAYANVVRGKASKVKDGIRQRDEAMVYGGYGRAGATTLVVKDSLIVMPPDDTDVLTMSESEALLIVDSLRPIDNDVIIIGSAVDRNVAREVSMAAAMTLFE